MSLNGITRRSFLKICGMTGLGLAVVPEIPVFAAETLVKETRFLMGTVVTIMIASSEKDRAHEALSLAFSEMTRTADLLDHHLPGSPLQTLNATGSVWDAPEDLVTVVSAACEYGERSHYAFDVTVKPLIDLMQAHKNPAGDMRLDRAEFFEAAQLVNGKGVRINRRAITLERHGMGITLDGIAKGFVVDRACEILAGQGMRNFLVNAGGDIRVAGSRNGRGRGWNVAVEDPSGSFRYPACIGLRDKAIATSGSYELYFDRDRTHHHLVNPQTGECPRHTLSVSVIAPHAMEADALATAFSVMEPEAALNVTASLPGRECLILCRDGAVFSSSGWG